MRTHRSVPIADDIRLPLGSPRKLMQGIRGGEAHEHTQDHTAMNYRARSRETDRDRRALPSLSLNLLFQSVGVSSESNRQQRKKRKKRKHSTRRHVSRVRPGFVRPLAPGDLWLL